jgi:hypothetical protein
VPEAPPAPDQPVGPLADPAAGAPAAVGGTGFSETFEIPIEFPKTSAWGGKIEISWKVTAQCTAAIMPQAGNQAQIGYSTKEGLMRKVAHKWALDKLLKDLGATGLITKAKFGVEGKVSELKGISIKAGFSLKGTYGAGEVNGILVKKEPGKDAVYGAVEIAYQTPQLKLVDEKDGEVEIAQITLALKASSTIEPKWVKIMADEVIKDAEIAVAEGGGTSALATAGAILDVAIPAALGAVAVGTVLGVANMFVQKANMDDMNKGLGDAIRGLRSGLYDGLANAPSAGGNELYAEGYKLGNGAYMAAVAKLAQLPELPPPDEIAASAREAAKKAAGTWKGLATVEDALRWGYFNKWVNQNHGLATFKGDAQQAVLFCFGVANEPSTGPHMKVWVEKSMLPDALKD